MKNKKTVILLSIFILFIGVSIAYFVTSTQFENEFDVATYKTTTTEVFTSPDSWTPGDEIAKTIVTKNEGSIPVAVRVSYQETFVDENGDPIEGLHFSPVKINLDNMFDWVKEGNYYYYKYPLDSNETTSSFMKSVTLNSVIGNHHRLCTTEGNKQVCESVSDGIEGGTYTLIVTKETVQYDAYKTAWNTNVDIEDVDYTLTYVNRHNAGSITPGDLLKVGNQEFYVFSTNSTSTELITRYNLNVGEMNNSIIEGIQDSSILGSKDGSTTYGNVAFDFSNYWYGKVGTGKTYSGTVDPNITWESYLTPYPYVYDENSKLYTSVNNYKNELIKKGINVTNTRLMNYNDAISLNCTYNSNLDEGSCASAPSWLLETSFWLGNATAFDSVLAVNSDGTFEPNLYSGGGTGHSQSDTNTIETWSYSQNENSDIGLRPIIEVPTSIIP